MGKNNVEELLRQTLKHFFANVNRPKFRRLLLISWILVKTLMGKSLKHKKE